MKNLISKLLSAMAAGLLLLPVTAGGAESTRILQIPLEETKQAALDFLQSHHWQVAPVQIGQGALLLDAERKGIQLEIILKPHSALATRVTVTAPSGQAGNDVAMLWPALEKAASNTESDTLTPRPSVPLVLLDMAPAIVCLYGDKGNVDFQASGFVVDRRGLIITTAHKLTAGMHIKIVFKDGRQAKGRILKTDKQKDLAMVQATGGVKGPLVNLAAGRFYLENGEKLFSITCPQPLAPQFHQGRVDGPPRKSAGQVLWQVKLNVIPGTSGSPVFDTKGRLAGVIKGRLRGTDSVGYIIPFETVLRFLEIY